jgi:tetratricopeptide (TPR) repeat protein
MGAYDAFRDRLVAEEVLGRGADLLVVLSGNNEWFGGAVPHPTLMRAARWLSRFAWFRRLQASLASPAPKPSMEELRAGFARNIELMARAGRRRGIPVVLCTLPNNVRDLPPNNEGMWPRRLAEGWARLEFGRPGSAVEPLEAYMKEDPSSATGAFLLGRAWDRAGKPELALDWYLKALDRQSNRCGPLKNRLIRETAAREGCRLADLDAEFSKLEARGLLGSSEFVDGVHWRVGYNRLASAVIAAAATGGAVLPAHESARSEYGSRNEDEEMAWYALRWAVTDGPDDPGEDSIELFRQAYLKSPAEVRRVLSSPAAARQKLQDNPWSADEASRVEQGWAKVLETAGEGLRRSRDARGALELLDAALGRNASLRWAAVYRAAAEWELGRRAAARRDLEALARRGKGASAGEAASAAAEVLR